jgi:hypothetical protein
MPNHFHLLVETGRTPLPQFMQYLLSAFSTNYNKRNAHRGHVFMSRFHSILVEQGSYFYNLIRYIHLNPLRAGIVSSIADLSSFQYSGHSAMLGGAARRWHDTAAALALFSDDPSTARRLYLNLLLAPDEDENARCYMQGNHFIGRSGCLAEIGPASDQRRYDFTGGVLGSTEFAQGVCLDLGGRNNATRRRGETHRLAICILSELLEKYRLTEQQLRSGTKKGDVSRARMELAYLLQMEGFSQSDIARFIRTSPSAVSKMLSRYRMLEFPSDSSTLREDRQSSPS